MSLEDQWIATEKRLLHEADSMAEFLQQLRSRISPELIGDRAWEITLEHARNLPVTVAALPFGFELPLHDPRAIADFGISVIGGGQSATFLEEKGKAEGADASSTSVAWLLGETESEVEQSIDGLRRAISFYGSTRSYHHIFEAHGFDSLGMRGRLRAWPLLQGP